VDQLKATHTIVAGKQLKLQSGKHRIEIDFRVLKHRVEKHPVRRVLSIDVLALVAVGSCGWSMKVSAQTWDQPIREPATESTPQTIKLADQLNTVGAKFFGAHWCPACKEQMKLFGKQAGRRLNYVECGLPDKYPDQVSQCRDARIQSIPTWTRPGSTRLEGVQSINALERWSDLKPPQQD
jgi:Zn ribbon nucleic-acid-binding protein